MTIAFNASDCVEGIFTSRSVNFFSAREGTVIIIARGEHARAEYSLIQICVEYFLPHQLLLQAHLLLPQILECVVVVVITGTGVSHQFV